MGTARIQKVLQISSGNCQYQTPPQNSAFTANVLGANGPTPGTILCALDPGTNISLTQLTSYGGFYEITNLDPVNYVVVGIYDPGTAKFYPIHDVLAGESYVNRLSQHFGEEYHGTGTGAASTNFQVRAYGAPVRVTLSFFDP
jgi:hypothetical protein